MISISKPTEGRNGPGSKLVARVTELELGGGGESEEARQPPAVRGTVRAISTLHRLRRFRSSGASPGGGNALTATPESPPALPRHRLVVR